MKTVEDEISPLLRGIVSPTTQRSLFNRLGGLANTPLHQLSPTDRRLILLELKASIRLFAPEESTRVVDRCTRALEAPGPPQPLPAAAVRLYPPPPPSPPNRAAIPSGIDVRAIQDVSRARLESWSQAVAAGLSKPAALRVAAAVTELATRIVRRAAQGHFEFRATTDPLGVFALEVIAREEGPPLRKRRRGAARGGLARAQAEDESLGLVRSLAQELEVEIRPGGGALVVCRFREQETSA
jgi:anti-sigma regulatory factor (Ser/Thr protein kinase)